MAIKSTAVKKTCIWGAFNTVFGVFPVFILWFIGKLPLPQKTIDFANRGYVKLIDDGAINFFFLAITGATIIDLLLARKKFENDYPLIMTIIGGLAVFLIVVTYMAFLLGGDEHHTFGQAKTIFWVIAGFTLCYCAHVKYNLSLKGE
jgi:hypothetical protein